MGRAIYGRQDLPCVSGLLEGDHGASNSPCQSLEALQEFLTLKNGDLVQVTDRPNGQWQGPAGEGILDFPGALPTFSDRRSSEVPPGASSHVFRCPVLPPEIEPLPPEGRKPKPQNP